MSATVETKETTFDRLAFCAIHGLLPTEAGLSYRQALAYEAKEYRKVCNANPLTDQELEQHAYTLYEHFKIVDQLYKEENPPETQTRKYRKKPVVVDVAGPITEQMKIKTLEGEMLALPGDYIITGVHGERYPCKPEIFLKTYELVEGN